MKFWNKQRSRFMVTIGIALLALGLAVGLLKMSTHLVHSAVPTMDDVLVELGFATPEQRTTLGHLMYLANIIPAHQPLADVYPPRKTMAELVQDILHLVSETQAHFTRRTGTQERWQIAPAAWTTTYADAVRTDVRRLGFVDAIEPVQSKPLLQPETDALCILGATLPTMKNRLSFAAHLIDQGFQTEQLILLTGERYITVGIDGTEPELQAIAKEFGLSDVKKLTETHLLRHAYQESSLAQCALCVPAGSAPAGSAPAGSAPAGSATPWSVHIIDTPRRDLPRPTTETTAVDLAAWLKTQPQIRRVIFVSNQPYVAYQRAVLQAVFTREYPACAITVVGQAADATEPPQTLVEALGGTIWAAMPAAMHKLKITVTEPQARAALETLYKKNPLIFSQLPKFD